MKVFIVWHEKSDPYSEDGDWLQAVFSTQELANSFIADAEEDSRYLFVTEEEVDKELGSIVKE